MFGRKTTRLFFRSRSHEEPSEPEPAPEEAASDEEQESSSEQSGAHNRILAKFAEQGRQYDLPEQAFQQDDPTPATVSPEALDSEEEPVDHSKHGTVRLQLERSETLTEYPSHEKACLDLLRNQGLPAQAEDIVGAGELLLTEDHMIVRFDVHVIDPRDNQRHRFLVDVDMSFGRLHDHKLTHLGTLAT